MSTSTNLALRRPAVQSSICSWFTGRTGEEDDAFANVRDIGRGEIDLLLEADLTGVPTLPLETRDRATGKARASALVSDGLDIGLGPSGRHSTIFVRDLG